MEVSVNVLDLFSGIGGFSIGLERAGMKTIAFAEIEPYCRRVLRHHWPDVPQFTDVKEINAKHFPHWWPDVICGGFPCQGLSLAGLGLGLADVRSALWFEYARIIGEFRPHWVIVENVPALRSRGLDQVLGSLAALGYDAEWNCIPAAAFGAPHRRDRIWIVAHPKSSGCGAGRTGRLTDRLAWIQNQARWNPANTAGRGCAEDGGDRSDEPTQWPPGGSLARAHEMLANPDDTRLEIGQGVGSDARPQRPAIERDFEPDVWQSRWTDEPALCGVDDGVSKGVDVGLYALGNSIVPQIAEAIGRAIIDWENDNAMET